MNHANTHAKYCHGYVGEILGKYAASHSDCIYLCYHLISVFIEQKDAPKRGDHSLINNSNKSKTSLSDCNVSLVQATTISPFHSLPRNCQHLPWICLLISAIKKMNYRVCSGSFQTTKGSSDCTPRPQGCPNRSHV